MRPVPFFHSPDGGCAFEPGELCRRVFRAFIGTPEGTLSVAVYLALGGMGLPVFSGARGGAGHLFGVTGGFLFGFLFLSFFAGLFREKKICFAGLIIGEAALYLMGTLWYVFAAKAGLWQAFCACCLPFLPGDAVKCVLALVLYRLFRARLGTRDFKQRSE